MKYKKGLKKIKENGKDDPLAIRVTEIKRKIEKNGKEGKLSVRIYMKRKKMEKKIGWK